MIVIKVSIVIAALFSLWNLAEWREDTLKKDKKNGYGRVATEITFGICAVSILVIASAILLQ